MFITPAGARKNTVEPEHMVKLRWLYDAEMKKIDTEPVFSHTEPSGELYLHELLQRTARTTRSVVHLHPKMCVAAILAGFKLDKLVSHFPELGRYTRVAPNVPKLPPISTELAETTYRSMTNQQILDSDKVDWFKQPEYDIVGMAGHGVTAIGLDPYSAFAHIERLESICEIVLASRIRPEDL
jgi:L-fuculose-phosphate aldolase